MAFTYDKFTESDSLKKKKAQAESNSTYNPSKSVLDAKLALASHEANQVADWDGGTYGQAVTDAINKITNREDFSYSLNGDALYQQYKNQYINQGRLAMQDAIGQASAMTGGYGNSYAATVGNQQYQAYLQKLNDIVPELYQLALDKYNQEGQDLLNQYSILNDRYNTEYGQYRDKVSDWNTTYERLSNKYYNESNQDYTRFADNRDYYTNLYNNAYNAEYSLYTDAYNRAFNNYQQSVSEDQWQKSFDENVRQYNQSYALQKQSANQSSTIASLRQQLADQEEKYSGYLSPEMQEARDSDAVKSFDASILTPTEFSKRGKKTIINGKSTRFDNYTQYVDAVLEKWLKENKVTENEVAYIKGYYGIE